MFREGMLREPVCLERSGGAVPLGCIWLFLDTLDVQSKPQENKSWFPRPGPCLHHLFCLPQPFCCHRSPGLSKAGRAAGRPHGRPATSSCSPPGQCCIFQIYLFSLPRIFARLKPLFPLPSLMSSTVHFRNKYLIRWKKQLLIM